MVLYDLCVLMLQKRKRGQSGDKKKLKPTKMSKYGFLDLHNDGLEFEGSNDELRISQKVFYENNVADIFSSKSCSENSGVTSQASSKDGHQKEADMMDFPGHFGVQSSSSMEWSVVGARIDHNLHAKRLKLSMNELSNFKPYLDSAVASSMPVKQVVSGMYDPSLHPFQVFMCHVVEASGEGVTSSCYLLKQYSNVIKQFEGSKSIASPISQESSALMVKKPGLLKCVERRRKTDISPEPEDDHVLLTSDSMDSRALLHSRVFHLLKTAGWSIEKWKRECGRYRYMYRSPEGKLYREFRRVWNILGQSVLGHCNCQVAGDDKHWSDVGHFWSDLYDTLRYIECEMADWKPNLALGRQWSLLNPFVTVVLIDRKIHALRAGNLGKAKQCDVGDLSCKADAKFRLKYEERDGSRSMDKHRQEIVRGSSLASQSTILDSGQSKQGALESYKVRSIYVSEGNCMRLVKTIDGTENLSSGTCTDELLHNPSHLPGCVSESTSIQSPTCLDNVPIGNGKVNMIEGLSEALSPNHDSFPGSLSCNKHIFKPNEVNAHDIAVASLERSIRPQKHNAGRRRSTACHLKDDDLLISAIIKKRSFKSSKNRRSDESGRFKLKLLKKQKSQKGSCRLLPRSLGKGSRHFKERWTLMGDRSVLSWLISTGAVSITEQVQYRDPKDDSVVKDGQITRHGILCGCCACVFSVSGFKVHAGFMQNRPCLNLFMGSGRPYTLCQLQAWSAEYKARRNSSGSIPDDEFDKNDDSCGLCGDGGELLCCDSCPSTFHQSCLSEEDLPEGSWYCSNCTCQLCGDLVNDKEASGSSVGLKCSHCERKYHDMCLLEKTMLKVATSLWFCDSACEEVYSGLQSRVGLCIPIADGYSWTLLRCIHDDQKIPSPQHFALKAECNSKLAVAVTIMEECFLSMTDPRTGIDMIPQVVYNWGSEFPRLDYHGFYTAVLEMDDVLISVACIRVHGAAVAEMPLIATCSKYRRQGMCRRLLDAIEKMLISLKVEKLVIAAIPDLVETWTVGFGFVQMEDAEKRSLRKINLMVFPGTIMLKKTLYTRHPTALQQGIEDVSLLENDKSFEMDRCLEGEPDTETIGALKSCDVPASMESELLNTSGSSKCKDKDTNITVSALEIELDVLNLQVIDDPNKALHFVENSESVEADEQTEVLSLEEKPNGKPKQVMGDKSQCMDQENPLSSLFAGMCLNEIIAVGMEKYVEVPFNVSAQVENGITETAVALELESSVLGQPGEVEGISEPKEPTTSAILKLSDSIAVKPDEGVARCLEKPDGSDQVQPQGSLHVLLGMEKCLSDKCSEFTLTGDRGSGAEIQLTNDNVN